MKVGEFENEHKESRFYIVIHVVVIFIIQSAL